jgi:diguanylate cyclase (GGDEF)-like protein
MTATKNTVWRFFLVVVEILIITYLDYKESGTYFSLDVLYCLPVIQAAHIGAIRAMRRSDTQVSTIIGVLAAVAWSGAEAAVIWPSFPMFALAMNIFTRSVTFTVLGRVVTKLWREREYSRKDTLTELANRLEFNERFETEQIRSDRSGSPYSLLYIDIDQFKKLNDQHGHYVGDKALQVVAHLLRENSRSVDTAARIGGDEFVLLYPETDEYVCDILAKRIKAASEQIFNSEGWQIALSIGHATATGKARTTDEILHDADANMYAMKKQKQ